MNSEPTHFLIFINNDKAFSSLDGMACNYHCSDQFQLRQWQAKSYWISWELEKPNLLENNPYNTKNNINSQIQNKNTLTGPANCKKTTRCHAHLSLCAKSSWEMAKNLNWDNFWDTFEAIYLEDASFSEKQVSFILQVIFSANFRLKA